MGTISNSLDQFYGIMSADLKKKGTNLFPHPIRQPASVTLANLASLSGPSL